MNMSLFSRRHNPLRARVWRALLCCALLLAPLLALGASGAQTASAHMLSPESLLNPDGTLNLAAGRQGTLDLRGWNVTLDAARGPILSRAQTASLAAPWAALPNGGLDGSVFALAVMGSDLYVGGTFTATADGAVTNLNGIAKFDGASWAALPNNGLSGPGLTVFALAVMGSDLYVGGTFTATADGAVTNLNGIAKFDGASWSALPNGGLDSSVNALAVIGSDLYVGGAFTTTADGAVTNLNRIAKFDGASWSALPNNGLGSIVRALAVIGSDLYVGGGFTTTADGAVTNLKRIAKFDGASWSALPNNGLNSSVRALAVIGSDLYVGGGFTTTADGAVTNLARIAKFDGASWAALPNNGLNSEVRVLAVSGSDLYVGGSFTTTADGAVTNLARIAKFDGASWAALPNGGLDSTVNALVVMGSDLYVGGGFTATADGAVTNLNRIAVYGLPSTDTTPPSITITTPADGATYTLGQVVNADYNCQDEAGGSGLVSCVGDVPNGSPIDTSSVGAKTFTVNAADSAGNTSSLTRSYSVVFNTSFGNNFGGPIDSPPVLNSMKAGGGVPVIFDLGGDRGLNILASGYPTSRQVACDTSAPVDQVEVTTSSNSGLHYDATTGLYTYVWKTDKNWTGSCRQFTLRLTDGSDHIALFKFTK
ncbi:MAG: PxKF domain-containing protein [Kouleothrix sp.]|nr:PxKF domain-containing protein [Kouleothrix sp.]